MNLIQAMILGAVEGLTEFLPVSSTGHLILAARAMGLSGSAIDAYEIVIQAGALLAVVWLYRTRVAELAKGVVTPHPRGRALLLKLVVAFLPAAAVGFLTHHWIKENLFGPRPVAAALIVGGVAILVIEAWRRRRGGSPRYATVDDFPLQAALLIGLAQCLSLWPGTSRALATIMAALLLGATPVAAAEFSFLLALPTLGMATLYDFVKNHDAILGPDLGGPVPVIAGLVVAAVVAGLAITTFLRYLNRRGLVPFGWYRIALGIAVFLLLGVNGEIVP
ncbi:MAG TPA: undecaprenyl-diphosphate phosphatase [Candidatus Eisenbacteria bacterium]|nr:undecaprenyl-diphosphate phosphatase [Candidatus Eisenbacteria bacterium]